MRIPPRRWGQAWGEALYGFGGFYRRELPVAHFRTSVTASPLFAGALGRLVERVDASLGRPDPFDVVDVGAADGTLLNVLGTAAPSRWRLTGVDLDDAVPPCRGVLVANEWLDTVPCDIVELTGGGPRYVREDGSLGEPPDAADRRWLTAQWPLRDVGDRAEVGRHRDAAWAATVGRVERGVAIAIDYAHERSARPPLGTLIGYRDGRPVDPQADGSCDITAHVALDACAGAAAADATLLLTQRAALRQLGIDGTRPAYAGDPGTYLRDLSAAGAAAELLDPHGLGGFGWLVQAKGCPLPLRH